MKYLTAGRLAATIASFLLLISCGGGSNNNTDSNGNPIIPKSNIAKRAFVTNNFFGTVNIINAETDAASSFIVIRTNGTQPTFSSITKMQANTGKTFLLDAGTNVVYLVDNATEQLTAGVTFGGTISNFVATADSKFVYAAIPTLNGVQWADITATTPTPTLIGLGVIRRLVATPDGTKILAFGDDASSFWIIKTSDNSAVQKTGFDYPYSAVISGDSTKAYILNCGRECGGIQAKVTVVDLTNNSVGASVNVGGATVGVLDQNNLYVAGSPSVSTPSTNGGTIDVVNVSTMTRTGGAAIADGLHEEIGVASNSKVYIGSRGCTQITSVKGCLSFFNTSANTATVGSVLGDVTAVTPISGRSVVYVIQGGDLRIYNTSTDTLQPTQIDFTGKLSDVKELK